MRTPPQAARDHLKHAARLNCPEVRYRAEHEFLSDGAACSLRELLSSWGDLEWLMREHAARRARWAAGPQIAALPHHPLMSVFKGRVTLDDLWDECSLDSNYEKRRGPATKALGCGDAWRFQAGFPFPLSDLPPIVGAGTLIVADDNRSWTAISTLHPEKDDFSPQCGHALLQLNGFA